MSHTDAEKTHTLTHKHSKEDVMIIQKGYCSLMGNAPKHSIHIFVPYTYISAHTYTSTNT